MTNHASENQSPWGTDDMMAVCAVRYCLGRITYVVGECREWLEQQWPHLSNRARDPSAIVRIEHATGRLAVIRPGDPAPRLEGPS